MRTDNRRLFRISHELFIKSWCLSVLLLLISCEYFISAATVNNFVENQNDFDDIITNSIDDSTVKSAHDNEPSTISRTCASWSFGATALSCGWEPNLRNMSVSFGPKVPTETFFAYVPPDVASFYDDDVGNKTSQTSNSPVLFAKFINLSPEPLYIYWLSSQNDTSSKRILVEECEPFGSIGTAAEANHVYIGTVERKQSDDEIDSEKVRWYIHKNSSLYYFDPFGSSAAASKQLSSSQFSLYQLQLQNKVFAEQYRAFTGDTDWLALYTQKQAPHFLLWRADHFHQLFPVVTKHIHFVEQPADSRELTRGMSAYGPRPDEVERMRRYRHEQPTLPLFLRVVSCAPRVFEIENFLSDTEIEHILFLAKADMKRMKTKQGNLMIASNGAHPKQARIPRHTDVIIDAIYQRTADVLQINEALLRFRRPTEVPEFSEFSTVSVAEKLQIVHYETGQEDPAHYDFSMPKLIHLQPSRFASVIFYLNDDMEGGETVFPKWLNAETSEALKLKPKKGNAILFYDLLPDGNYDERALHATLPVTKGEMWLAKLWIWDPMLDHTKVEHY